MYHFDMNGFIRQDENISLMRYVPKKNKPEHTHAFIELVYVLSGKDKPSVNSAWYPVAHGNLLFINFKQTHAFCSLDKMEIINCLIQSVAGTESSFIKPLRIISASRRALSAATKNRHAKTAMPTPPNQAARQSGPPLLAAQTAARPSAAFPCVAFQRHASQRTGKSLMTQIVRYRT